MKNKGLTLPTSPEEGVEGAIISGGKSLRMGKDKGTLRLDGELLLGRIINVMKESFSRVTLISDNPEHDIFTEVDRFEDIEKGKGPLGGIFTALYHSKFPYVFCCACDMPFLNTEMINTIVKERTGCDVAVPEINGTLQPLSAVYSKNCIKHVYDAIKQENLRLTGFFNKVNVKKLQEGAFTNCDYSHSFTNINTPKEFMDAEACIKKKLNRHN